MRVNAERVLPVGGFSGTDAPEFPRRDLRVTQMTLYRDSGEKLTIYMIGLASKEGVYVLSI